MILRFKTSSLLMLGCALLSGLLVNMTGVAWAEPQVQGQISARYDIDLNQDREDDHLYLVDYNFAPNGYYRQLVVTDAKDNVLFSGTRIPATWAQSQKKLEPRYLVENTMVLGEVDGFKVDVLYVFDPDKDGHFRVISYQAPRAQEPMRFRMARWDGEKLVPVFNNFFLRENPDSLDNYEWTETPMLVVGRGWTAGTWITELKHLHGLTFKAEIKRVQVPIMGVSRSTKILNGEAEVVPDKYGFKIQKWTKTLQ